jgi:hypothetical protein
MASCAYRELQPKELLSSATTFSAIGNGGNLGGGIG